MDPARRQRALRQHLLTERLLGLDAVPLGQAPTIAAPAEPEPAATPEAAPSEPPRAEPAAPAASTPAAEPTTPAAATPTGAAASPPMARNERIQALEQMAQQEVAGCTKCALCQSRTNTVFGEGDPEAPIMFIGEGPGQNEDEQARPFVGRAGDLLTKMINAMGYDREAVYIANIVKCRPPNNRTPGAVEVQTCWDYLRRQIEIIRPGAIVTVGGPATKIVLQTKDGITKLRGNWYQYAGVNPPIPVMPTFHPAFLLRSYTKDNRAKVWSDLQKVMDRVGAAG
jgi:DNA polymerase